MGRYFNKNYNNISEIKNEMHSFLRKVNPSVFWKFNIACVREIWPSVVGCKLAEFTCPNRIYKNVLYVNCKHPSLIQSLLFYKTDILRKLKQKIEKCTIEDVSFQAEFNITGKETKRSYS